MNMFSSGNRNVLQMNGVKVETNLDVMASGTMYRFGDGSWYDASNGRYHVTGKGYIKVNGRTLKTSGNSEPTEEDKPAVQTYDYTNVQSLMFDTTSADVTVEPCKSVFGEGHVQVEGPKSLVDEVKVRKAASAIVIDENSSSGGSIINTGIRVGNVNVGVGVGELKITVKVPYGTQIVVRKSGSGDINIGDVNGALEVDKSGSGDISIGEARGKVDLRSSGSGDIDIRGGKIDVLNVDKSGSCNISVRATAQNANLRQSGSGDIYVERVVNQPVRRSTGSGEIKIRHIG